MKGFESSQVSSSPDRQAEHGQKKYSPEFLAKLPKWIAETREKGMDELAEMMEEILRENAQ